ncbi:hypothetical protein [Bartonella ancashensis]|uniref:DUF2232 domain-containing protein n=1 Tax=Bartonella ancashensis TaxID=1318743 RepID=A0A0M3T349_9HYPH|nr:hypothetical protein [Bartonella ancashensis]ALE03981.1 hypothetical protein PU02_1167 [Bartonella ancashensis]
MRNFCTYEVIVSVLSGVFSAFVVTVAVAVAHVAPYLSFLLGCFVSLPIFISAFGLGTSYSIIALVSATSVLAVANHVYIAVGFMLLCFLPAVYTAWLLGLAQKTQENETLRWYPLSSVIFLLTNFIACISIFIGFYIGSHPDTPTITQKITQSVIRAMQQSQSIDESDILVFGEFFVTHSALLIALALTIYSLVFLICNLYFSTIIAQRMKWLTRPRDDWKKTFRLPISGLAIFIIACISSMIELGFFLDLSARIFTTAYIIIISISGLAYLHNITQGINSRIIILSLVYIAILTVVFASPVLFIILLMGIWATIQYNRPIAR